MSLVVTSIAQSGTGLPTIPDTRIAKGPTMHDESTADQPTSAGARLRALIAARLFPARPGLLLCLGVALALLGYALPLLFPAVTLISLFKLGSALQDAGVPALVGAWPDVFLVALSATLSVSLWRLRVGVPGGEPVLQQQTPDLFALVDEMRAIFKAPAITDVHLSEYAQLRVYRVPRSGYPFLFRHVLVAGMPTLQCLTLEQFKCLLASCLGELSAVRTDVAGWIRQLADTWAQYHTAVAGGWSPAALLYRGFTAWYVPVLTSLAQRLDAGHRLRRDYYALEVAADDLVVDMIAGEVVMARFLGEHYWPTVYRTAEHSATPSFKVFRNLETVFQRRVDNDIVQLWIREAFVGKWRSDDQDPGLKARLREIGHSDIAYRRPSGPSAAHRLLGAGHQWIVDRCDARWAEEHREEWQRRHEKFQRQYERLEMLREVMAKHGLRGEEAMAYAALVKRYGTAEDARGAYESILATNPDDAQIAFGVGKFFLASKDARGVEVLERAMALDKRYVDPACRLISAFVATQRAGEPVRKPVARV